MHLRQKIRPRLCLFALLIEFSSFAHSGEKLSTKSANANPNNGGSHDIVKLEKSLNIAGYSEAIKTGDQRIYSRLPAKGYSNGVAGILKKLHLFVNPEYSFADCGYDAKVYSVGKYGDGCRVSLKLARRSANGTLEDIGIRAEWARDFADKNFVPNNSVWAIHITNGDGVVESAVSQ